jgi:hypothetical protein
VVSSATLPDVRVRAPTDAAPRRSATGAAAGTGRELGGCSRGGGAIGSVGGGSRADRGASLPPTTATLAAALSAAALSAAALSAAALSAAALSARCRAICIA